MLLAQTLDTPPASPAPPLLLTVGYTYYNDFQFLGSHLTNWVGWPSQLRARVFFLFVDDGSPTEHGAEKWLGAGTAARAKLHLGLACIDQDLTWRGKPRSEGVWTGGGRHQGASLI